MWFTETESESSQSSLIWSRCDNNNIQLNSSGLQVFASNFQDYWAALWSCRWINQRGWDSGPNCWTVSDNWCSDLTHQQTETRGTWLTLVQEIPLWILNCGPAGPKVPVERRKSKEVRKLQQHCQNTEQLYWTDVFGLKLSVQVWICSLRKYDLVFLNKN